MGDEGTVVALAEGEREALEDLARAVPDELVGEHLDLRLERQPASDRGVEAIRAHEKVAFLRQVGDDPVELQAYSRRLASVLQDLQELEPRDPREAVAVDVDLDVAVHDALDRPALHCRREPRVHRGLVPGEELERALREHHAEAEGGAARVLLDHHDLVCGALPLHEQGEEQARRAGADDRDPHA